MNEWRWTNRKNTLKISFHLIKQAYILLSGSLCCLWLYRFSAKVSVPFCRKPKNPSPTVLPVFWSHHILCSCSHFSLICFTLTQSTVPVILQTLSSLIALFSALLSSPSITKWTSGPFVLVRMAFLWLQDNKSYRLCQNLKSWAWCWDMSNCKMGSQ